MTTITIPPEALEAARQAFYDAEASRKSTDDALRAAAQALLEAWPGMTDMAAVEGLEITQQKTKKQLFVPIFAELRPTIAEARKRGRIYIVSRPDGRPFTVDQFHAMWGREMAKESEKEGLARIRAAGLSFHGLRKEFVVDGSHRDLTPHQIGSLTGQTIQTVQHYSRGASQKRLAKEAVKKLEGGTG